MAMDIYNLMEKLKNKTTYYLLYKGEFVKDYIVKHDGSEATVISTIEIEDALEFYDRDRLLGVIMENKLPHDKCVIISKTCKYQIEVGGL